MSSSVYSPPPFGGFSTGQLLANINRQARRTDPATLRMEAEDAGIELPKSHTRVAAAKRPDDIYYTMTRQNNWYYLYADIIKILSENSLVKTLWLRISSELTRFDTYLEPNFAVKCNNCGYESTTIIDKCPYCTHTEFSEPDKREWEVFRRSDGRWWWDCVNNNNQSLKDLIKLTAQNQVAFNQSYTLCNTRTTYDENGDTLISRPEEFVVLDPIKVQQLFNDAGELGKTFAFTMEDRTKMINIEHPESNDLEEMTRSRENGLRLYYAAYKVGINVGAAGKYYLYTKDEVYQDHWFVPSLTYGVPIWFSIMDDIKAWSAIEKSTYKRYDLGYVRKIVFIPGVSEEDIDDMTKGITDALSINDHSIPIVCMPPSLSGTAPMQAQALDLGTESMADELQAKDDIRNRICAFIGVPNLFAGDVNQSGGLNNESQQITIFDRSLSGLLDDIDRYLKWWQSWFGAPSWTLKMDRPTKNEMNVKKRIDKMQEAQMMKQMGFLIQWKNGEFTYSERPWDQQQRIEQAAMQKEQMEQQKQMMQMQMMQGGQPGPEDNGILPGDGDGPPEQGSARRADPDIDATKDEIDQTMREADQ